MGSTADSILDRETPLPHPPAVRWLALVLFALVLLASALSFWPYTVDDAFITQRYARHLAEGLGPVYNPGERVEGYSNPLWTGISALLHLGGAPRIEAVKALGVLCALLLIPLTYRLGRRAGLTAGWALIPPAVVATNASVALWAVSGLETTSLPALVLAAVLRFEAERERSSRRPWSALLWVLVWLTRPEAPAYLVYPLVRRALDLRSLPFGARDLRWLALFGLPVLAFEAFGLLYYGALLPATHGAKLGDGPEILRGDLSRWLLWRFAVEQGTGFLLASALLAGGTLWAAVRGRLSVAVWAPLVAALAFIAYAFTDWMPRYRFMVSALPFFAVAGVRGVQLTAQSPRVRAKWPAWPVFIAGFAVTLFSFGARDQATRGFANRNAVHLAVSERGDWWNHVRATMREPWHPGRQEEDAWYVTLEVPPGEWIGIFDIGLIGELSDHLLWDARGLVTPMAARGLQAADDSPERAAMWDDLWEKRPAVVIVPQRPGRMPRVPRVFYEGLRSDPRFVEAYEELPELLPFRTVFRRKDLVPPADPGEYTEAAFGRLPNYRTPSAMRWR